MTTREREFISKISYKFAFMFRFIGSEQNWNLFVCQRENAPKAEAKGAKMFEVGRIHIGDRVNVFKHGSLVRQSLGHNCQQHTGSILIGKRPQEQ